MKRHSWEMKNFVPTEKPQVPLLMSTVDQQLSVETARSSDDDEELDSMCFLDVGHPRLSPLAVIDDKSALAYDSSIVGMSHNIDDVVESVIKSDDLPPLADLPPPSLPLASLPAKPAVTAHSPLYTDELTSMPKLTLNVPGLTYVNSEPAVLVRLKRLDFHSYRSANIQQHVDTSAASSVVKSFSATSVAETACQSKETTSTLDGTSKAKYTSTKQKPTVPSASRQMENGALVLKLHKSVSSGEKSSKSRMKKSHVSTGNAVDGSRQSPVVVLNELPAEALRCSGQVMCSAVETERPVSASQSSKSSSAKRKSDTVVSESSDVKKQRTRSLPTANDNKLR